MTRKSIEPGAAGETMSFLPQPLVARRLEGSFDAGVFGLSLTVHPELAWLGNEINEYWKKKFGNGLHVIVNEAKDWEMRIGREVAEVERAEGSSEEEAPLAGEAYAIHVDNREIRMYAGAYRGAMYAWFTLKQALDDSKGDKEVPALLVRDEPGLSMRGFHFDMKGAVPYVGYIEETIERLASYKINTLFVEYENQFEFAGVPGIHKAGGLSAEDRNRIARHASRYGMETIPVVQCLGHADYALTNEHYAERREDGFVSQYCPSDPRTFELVTAMIDEIAAAHPDSAYMHIGADETLALGRCEKCREAMGAGGKADLYIAYVGRVASYVLSKGKKPIVWDDMFHSEKCVERIVELPAGTVVCSWSYYEFGEPSAWFWYGGGYYSSRGWRETDPGAVPGGRDIEDLSEEDSAVVRRLWDGGQYPEYGVSAVPWIRHYLERGYEVIGASCVRGADFINQWSAIPEDRIANARFWARSAASAGLTGTLASAWARFYSLSPPVEHWETGWYPTLAQAAFSWRPDMADDEFDRLFALRFLEGEADVMQALEWIGKGYGTRDEIYFGRRSNYFREAARKLEVPARRQDAVGRYAEGLRLTAVYEGVAIELENALKQNEWRTYYADSRRWASKDLMFEKDMRGLERATDKAEAWEQESLAYVRTFMPEGEAEELVLTKLHAYKERARRLRESFYNSESVALS